MLICVCQNVKTIEPDTNMKIFQIEKKNRPYVLHPNFAFKYTLHCKASTLAPQLSALNPKSNVIEKYSISNGKMELCARFTFWYIVIGNEPAACVDKDRDERVASLHSHVQYGGLFSIHQFDSLFCTLLLVCNPQRCRFRCLPAHGICEAHMHPLHIRFCASDSDIVRAKSLQEYCINSSRSRRQNVPNNKFIHGSLTNFRLRFICLVIQRVTCKRTH